jgi:hypothetical protein
LYIGKRKRSQTDRLFWEGANIYIYLGITVRGVSNYFSLIFSRRVNNLEYLSKKQRETRIRIQCYNNFTVWRRDNIYQQLIWNQIFQISTQFFMQWNNFNNLFQVEHFDTYLILMYISILLRCKILIINSI